MAITYNVLNLQQSLSQDGTTVASYIWLADGTKCAVVDNTTNGYDYLGSLIYSRSGSVRTLESAAFGGGRFVNTNNTILPYYYITDHLGSTRVITDNSGSVVERNDYYPFGGKHANSSYAQLTTNKQKFNGKELQTTGNTGFLDYGARMYDDVIGRWGVVDPMVEKRQWASPYNFVQNNPLAKIDPNGMLDDNYDIYAPDANGNTNITVERTNDATNTYTYYNSDGSKADLGTYAKTNDMVKLDENNDYYTLAKYEQGLNFINGDVAAGLLGASYSYTKETGLKVEITQLNNEQGGHSSHSGTGTNADVRYANLNGNANQPVLTSGNNFDSKNSQILANKFAQFGFNSPKGSILTENSKGNGPALKNTIFVDGSKKIPPFHHKNHMHLQKFNYNIIKNK